ncbi:MAG: hypothetical protein AAF492_31500, partial [Verrucomicrobiota bacterium]
MALLFSGCGKPPPAPTGPARPWADFLADLTHLEHWPRLDTEGALQLASSDRSGRNQDYNRFDGESENPGWLVVANLTGPGVVRRFWLTGVDEDHPLKIYFDGETSPRLSGTVSELFGGQAPFLPPLAQRINLCWVSYVPLTFSRSIRIETKAPPLHHHWGQRKLFYHVNVEPLPSTNVESFPASLNPSHREALDKVSETWLASTDWPTDDPGEERVVEAGQETVLLEQSGPGTVEAWNLSIKPQGKIKQIEKEYLLQ